MLRKTPIIYLTLFIACLISRIIFLLISGYDSFELFADAHRYDMLSDRIVDGNFNLDVTAYIVAPLYPWTLALFKWLVGEHWILLAVSYQFILVSISVVFLYKLSFLLFNDTKTSLLASVVYIFFPMTLWYNHTLVQESSFQAFFIFFSYTFIKFVQFKKPEDLFFTSVFFSLSLLTKSHIIILLPFLSVIFLIQKSCRSLLYFVLIIIICSLPFSIINYNQHKVFTLSSHGWASLFLLGQSEEGYNCLTKTSGEMGDIHSEGCNADIIFNEDFNYGKLGYVNKLNPAERNKQRFNYAFDWIISNPGKFLTLKIHGLKRFLLPGLDWNQYKTRYWLPSFIIGLLLYLPAYIILLGLLRKNNESSHYLLVSLIITIGLIFLIFLPMNRFRVITLEPMIIIYASVFYSPIIKKAVLKIRDSF